ncbi:MAG TPA: DUF6544 family protein [Propionibacteriaceae bacterium]
MVAHLPEPAQRWLTHAIAPGTPLATSVELRMSGQIRLGAWRPFTARQVLAPPDGFVWAATARVAGLPVSGFDRLSSGAAEMRWRLLGLIPVLTAAGPDVTTSAAGRLAAEGTLLPTVFPAATWTAAGTDQVTATWQIGGHRESVELHLGERGELRQVLIQRWGNPNDSPYGRYPFGVSVEAEGTFAGITIPSRLTAGWWWGTERQPEGEFFRAQITGAVFR